ncbi:MAG: hypothetical protein FWE76_01080 [Symbiobacteriaceae bacterium]|nr:hypothetical protein [Symbiobacteriaceae bacterium]
MASFDKHTYLKNQPPFQVNGYGSFITCMGSEVSQEGYPMIISNNPEVVTTDSLADNGFFLNRNTIKGRIRYYSWHSNGLHEAINHTITVHNPHAYKSICVSGCLSISHQYDGGICNGSDFYAWRDYFTGMATPFQFIVPAGGYQPLFNTEGINYSKAFGAIIEITISYSSNILDEAVGIIWDVAYQNHSDQGVTFATPVGNMARGKCDSCIIDMRAKIDVVDSTKVHCLLFGAPNDLGQIYNSFNDGDLITFIDEAPSSPVDLRAKGKDGKCKNAGNFGALMLVGIALTNRTGTEGSFRISLGSHAGWSFPLVKSSSGSIVGYNESWIDSFHHVDVIDIGKIANDKTEFIDFFTVVPAMASAVYAVGIRRVE